jgi:hypothetical protein
LNANVVADVFRYFIVLACIIQSEKAAFLKDAPLFYSHVISAYNKRCVPLAPLMFQAC